MIIDLNSAEPGSAPRHYDICICGAGPAGITTARVLAKHGKKVAIFEGGGMEYTELSQELYEGKSIGREYWDWVKTARLRFFGGTSNHWAGRCSYFDEIDFEQRDYFGLPGWPIARNEVLQYFDAACSILDISRKGFQSSQEQIWEGENFRISEVTRSPPTRFRVKYGPELKKSSNIDVYINANLTSINLNENHDAVTWLEVNNYSHKQFIFSANHYVIALGTIENSRLLLNCDKQAKGGIGNQNGMVGCCFMEHLNIFMGKFVSNNDSIWQQDTLELAPSESMLRRLQIGNGVLAFQRHTTPADARSYGRLRVLKQTLREMICKSETAAHLIQKELDFVCPGDGVITTMIEQSPNLNSRIYIGSERDMFGMRRVKLDWQLNDRDKLTMRTLGLEAAKSMARYGSARVQLEDCILGSSQDFSAVIGHAHQMGGTRMSENPKYGVVDKNSQIHGLKNIFIAGSSVFPTGGGCNPTFTVVMLAERLGHHLAKI